MDTSATQSRWRRRLLLMSPSLLVLLGILAYNWFVYWQPQPQPMAATSVAATAVPSQTETAATTALPSASQPEALSAATAIVPTATAIPQPQPTIPADAQIGLLGPPSDTSLPISAPITLYWQWPLLLPETQQFVVYVRDVNGDGTETAVGTLIEPNLGSSYRLTIPAAAWGDSVTAVAWVVQLEEIATGAVLRRSEPRNITLLPSR